MLLLFSLLGVTYGRVSGLVSLFFHHIFIIYHALCYEPFRTHLWPTSGPCFLFFFPFFFFFLYFLSFSDFFSLIFCLQCTTEPDCTTKWAFTVKARKARALRRWSLHPNVAWSACCLVGPSLNHSWMFILRRPRKMALGNWRSSKIWKMMKTASLITGYQ